MDGWKVWLAFAVIPNQIAGRILLVTEMDAASSKEMLTSAFTYTSQNRLSRAVTIEISRDSETEGYKEVCQEFSKGVSLAVDLTWTGWPRLQDLCLTSGVPYVLLESPLRVFVRALDGILRGIRNASDAIIILSDRKFLEELLYYIVGLTHIRVYVLPGLSPDAIHAIKDMRPTPSFFVVLAPASDMNVIVSTAVEHQLMKNERWHLVFTDYNFASFNKSFIDVTSTYVTMNPDLCCKFLRLPPTCQCPRDFDAFERMKNITVSQAEQLLTSILQDARYPDTPLVYMCDSSATASNDTRSSFYQLLNQTLSTHPTLAALSSPETSIVPRITFDVNTTLQGDRIGSWSVEDGLTLNISYLIVPVKRFFMVGVIQAIPWSYRLTGPAQDGTGSDEWGGYCLDFLNRLAYELNFDYQLVPSKSFGSPRADRTWDGLVGDLVAGVRSLTAITTTRIACHAQRTDLVVAPLTMTAEREEVPDFVAPYFEQTGISMGIVIPAPRTDLVVAPLTMTAEREEVLDFVAPYFEQPGISIAIRTDLVVAPLTMTAEREEVLDFVAPYFEQTGISMGIVIPALIKYKRNP
ncbi:hypothetical protein J6590_038985 [Homalodisca vitripennis]|nr:hypothetical protein J6590_038985 [Homalodisca vitripennis]